MKTPFHSLRWRLQAWHGLLLLLVIMASILPSYHLARENQMQRIDHELRQLEMQVIRSLMRQLTGTQEGQPPTLLLPPEEFFRRLAATPVLPPAEVMNQFEGQAPGHAYFAIRDRDGHELLSSGNAPTDLVFAPTSTAEFTETSRSIANRREYARTSSLGFKIVVGRDISPVLHDMHAMAWIHAGVGLGVWALGLLGGGWLSGRAIRPIQTISATATRIADGNLRERIDPTAMDLELAQLSQVLNETFNRLHIAFERQRQFTADASHELRTPITILISETQRLLKRERTAEEYREALQVCGDTAQRMRKLVEALLMLARQDHHEMAEAKQPCDLAEIVSEVADQLAPLAQQHGRQIELHLRPATCPGDPSSLAVLAANLISNGLQHGGNVVISTSQQHDQACLTVDDDGPGISETDLPHVFDRFFRADQARTGTSGHSGLGLAIAKAVADNHQGLLQASHRAPSGARFEFRMASLSSGHHSA